MNDFKIAYYYFATLVIVRCYYASDSSLLGIFCSLKSSVLTGEYLTMFERNVVISIRLNITEVGGNTVPAKCR
jgi:hypothetical protein